MEIKGRDIVNDTVINRPSLAQQTTHVQRKETVPHEVVPTEFGMHFHGRREGVNAPFSFDPKFTTTRTFAVYGWHPSFLSGHQSGAQGWVTKAHLPPRAVIDCVIPCITPVSPVITA
jgi:hypothetical protein